LITVLSVKGRNLKGAEARNELPPDLKIIRKNKFKAPQKKSAIQT
jgi:hypothetical protein